MKIIVKGIKLLGIALAVVIVVVIVGAAIFMNINPQFGGAPSESQMQEYKQSPQYKEGIFVNEIPTTRDIGFVNTVRVIYDFLFNEIPGLKPASPIEVQKIDSLQIIEKPLALPRLTWFGHSACLLEIEGKRIFFDPMLGESPAPIALIGPKRFSKELPIAIEQLPYIDAVVLSHDHYDHLDYESVVQLKDKVGKFYVPLGVSAHLIKWSVPAEKIVELDWWEESQMESFTFTCAPARHFSGRGLFDGFSTLWASWIVKTEKSSVYFSGDSGYGRHFKEIGNRFGPFDFVMLECGQYNELWKDIHMMPEQTVQAAIDLKGKLMMPIHWGAFTLAMHTWTDPIDRVTLKAHERFVPITTPRIGEPVILQQSQYLNSTWWEKFK